MEKHLLLTRYNPGRALRGEMLKVEDVLEILSIPLLGIVPESEEVLRASNVGAPVMLHAPESAPARAYFEAAKRLQGADAAGLGARGAARPDEQAVREARGMNLFSFLSRGASAPVARERLQILLAHERAIAGGSDLMATLKEEILAVIAKHFPLEREKVQVKLDRGDAYSTLEIDIEVPSLSKAHINPGGGNGEAKLAAP